MQFAVSYNRTQVYSFYNVAIFNCSMVESHLGIVPGHKLEVNLFTGTSMLLVLAPAAIHNTFPIRLLGSNDWLIG